MKSKKVAIFDLDGTILDTLEDLTDATNYALRQHGYPEHTIEEIRTFVGNGIRKLIIRALPAGAGEENIERVHTTFDEYYSVHLADKTKPYEGICDVIAALRERGLSTAVVSNKPDYGVQSLVKDYFEGLFDYSVGERPGVNRKPSPDGVNQVLEYFGAAREDAVYIGDSEVDFETSKNAKMDVIMVDWGFRSRDYISSLGAELIVSKPQEILEIL